MALIQMTLPLCDVCGEPFLPRKGPARDDPRGYNLLTKLDPKLPPMRCGKCKSFGWDSNFLGDRRKKSTVYPELATQPAGARPILRALQVKDERERQRKASPKAQSNRSRCKHQLYNCLICRPEARA
jgi:hypothetical protein